MPRFYGPLGHWAQIVLLPALLLIIITVHTSKAATFCVSTASDLEIALFTAEDNGGYNTIQIVQGTYEGKFFHFSSHIQDLVIEGGYVENCASRIVDPTNTVLVGFLHISGIFLENHNVVVDGLSITNSSTQGLEIHQDLGLVSGKRGQIFITNNIISMHRSPLPFTRFSISGGGISLRGISGSDIFLKDNNIFANMSKNFGGGIKINDVGKVTLINNIISKNEGRYGSGIYINKYFVDIFLINNTITKNILIKNGSSLAGRGVNIPYASKTEVYIYNNIIWGNYDESCLETSIIECHLLEKDIYLSNQSNDLTHLFHNNFSRLGTYIRTPFPLDPSNLDNIDPLFIDAENGNYHVQSGSLVDAGDNNVPSLPSTDHDGNPRIMDGTVDLGALELPGTVPPRIDAIVPIASLVGTTVTIAGEDFGDNQGSGTVAFGSNQATVTSWSDSRIEAVIPSLPPDIHDVIITTNTGRSNAVTVVVLAESSDEPPAITSIFPSVAEADDQIQLHGENFGPTPGELRIGNVIVTSRIWTDSFITFILPELLPSEYQIEVKTSGGASQTPIRILGMAPVIDAVSPPIGAIASTVAIKGHAFGDEQGASTIMVGGIDAEVLFWGNKRVAFKVPNLGIGASPVTLRTDFGQAQSVFRIRDFILLTERGDCDESFIGTLSGTCWVLLSIDESQRQDTIACVT